MRPVRAVNFNDLLTVGIKERYHYINAALVNNYRQELTGGERDSIRVSLTADKLAFNGFAKLKHQSALVGLGGERAG
ncbi:MAG: hypothetical protein DMF64_00080 [Acidobacteria bacterium]|nr:MAG: hypothetical protein DMF64_00080 [Acidobacteriota bacterium]